MVLASDGRRLAAALPGDRLFAAAAATPGAFQALLGLPLGAEDLIALLLGDLDLGVVTGTGPPGSVAIDRKLPGGASLRYRIWPDAQGRAAQVEVQAEEPGREVVRLQVAYADYRASAGGILPHEVSVSWGDRTLSLRLRKAGRRELSVDAFRLAQPAGFERVELSQLFESGSALFGKVL